MLGDFSRRQSTVAIQWQRFVSNVEVRPCVFGEIADNLIDLTIFETPVSVA